MGQEDDSILVGNEILLRELPGRGVAAFAARSFQKDEVVLKENALVVSSVVVPGADGELTNWRLWQALLQEERQKRLPVFDAGGHMGALAALRDLGPEVCRKKILGKCCTGPFPQAKEAKREAEVLRHMVRAGHVPTSAATFPAGEYARLRRVFQLNGFRFNGEVREGEPGYDVGEALFDNICRFNHSCAPNLQFDLSGSGSAVTNCVTATRAIEAGEELNISYLPVRLRLPVAERRKQLREHWGFDCDCPLCMQEGGPPLPTELRQEPRPPPAPRERSAAGKASVPGGDADASSDEGVCWDDLCDPEEP